ncbi:MAG TPA: rhomboid family intramembrane serine protease [Candidatus Limnocylindria bacterium]|nr:rhomboid family intramembrane serine protease [Candidatus Limnocylindria bacterium]
MTDDSRLRLEEGRRLLDGGSPEAALDILMPLTAQPHVGGEAWLLTGTARYRLDDEDGALTAWQRAADAGGQIAWLGWRSVAEQHVRNGDLDDAITAYREADRRAPAHERGAIANRIAWLLKETGHDFAARRQFNRARGAYAAFPAYVTWAIVAINVLVFVADAALTSFASLDLMSFGGPLVELGAVNGHLVAQGEWWRIVTSAFLHLGLLHLAFNMYALWLFGPVIEQLYGHLEFLTLYMLCAIGGSVLTILLQPDSAAAGASGAIFGLFGLAFVVSRRRHLLLGPQARAILSQVGTLLVLNLFITFIAAERISWTGHVGGLAVGAVLGLLLAPRHAPTMGGMWRAADGSPLTGAADAASRALAYAFVAATLAAGTWVAVQQIG